VLSGPGGVGKGTIAARAVAADPTLRLSQSWTTRAPRPGEDPDAYRFVTRADFEAHRERGGFLETNEFLGNYYGTPVPADDDATDLLLEIDVNGARQVAGRHPDALMVFVDAPTRADQRARLEARGDGPEQVQERLAEGERERADAEALGYHVVINDELDRAVQEVLALVDTARRAATR
jgi:guanylate kinase